MAAGSILTVLESPKWKSRIIYHFSSDCRLGGKSGDRRDAIARYITLNALGPGIVRTQEFISRSFRSKSRNVVLLST